MTIDATIEQACLSSLAGDEYKAVLKSLDSFYSNIIINLKYCRTSMLFKDEEDFTIVLKSLKANVRNKVKAIRDMVSTKDLNIDFRNYLHDSVLQNFATVILGISMCEKMLVKPQTERHKLCYLETIIRENRSAFRHKFFAAEFNNIPLDEWMIPSLNDRLNLIQEVFGLSVDRKISGNCDNIPKNVLKNVYQISKEGLSNIVKHSKASEVFFAIKLSPGNVEMKLKDNGVGFDVKTKLLDNNGHFGLPGILWRSKSIQAKTVIKSLPDKGSEISFLWSTSVVSQT